MVLKVGGACGRRPIGALPGQTDTVLSRSSVSSGSVLAGGRCQRHRPAKQSVLLKGVACPTHTHTWSHKQGDGAGVKSVLLLMDRGPHTHAISNILQWTWYGWPWQSATSPNWVAHATSACRMATPPGKSYNTKTELGKITFREYNCITDKLIHWFDMFLIGAFIKIYSFCYHWIKHWFRI